jgi:hypothetical protein
MILTWQKKTVKATAFFGMCVCKRNYTYTYMITASIQWTIIHTNNGPQNTKITSLCIVRTFCNFKGWSNGAVKSTLGPRMCWKRATKPTTQTIHYCPHHSNFWSLCIIVLLISTCEILTWPPWITTDVSNFDVPDMSSGILSKLHGCSIVLPIVNCYEN